MYASPVPGSPTPGLGGPMRRHGGPARPSAPPLGTMNAAFKTPRAGTGRSSARAPPTPSAWSQVLETSEVHSLVALTAASPVLVTEILTLAEKPTDVSVWLSTQGWAWLVHGRRLVIWRYRVTPGQRTLNSTCRELSLPASDVSHHARLVNVFAAHENVTPSCLAVSPEGMVRFWPNIAHPSTSTEVSTDLQGQECYSLTDVQPLGSVLATTTSTIVLVHVVHSGGPHRIACRQLKPPHGLLGGLGRRVSSLFWGGMPVTGEAKLASVQARLLPRHGQAETYVLTSLGLQKWLLDRDGLENLLYELPVAPLSAEAFLQSTLKSPDADPASLRIWPLDMHLLPGGSTMAWLLGAVQAQNPEEIHIGLGLLDCSGDTPPTEFKSFWSQKHAGPTPGSNVASLGYQLLFPNKRFGYLYNTDMVICVPVPDSEDQEQDAFDFSGGGNAILGAKSVEGKPVFFTANHGLVALSLNNPSHSILEHSSMSLNDSVSALEATGAKKLSTSMNLSAISQSGLDNLSISESKSDQLKAAFLLYCKRNIAKSTSIIESLFPSDAICPEVDSSLDKLVLTMSKDLIDDFPASDPRWMESVPASETISGQGMGSTMSLLILHQLEDKQTALEFYVGFLKQVGLWEKLCGVSIRDTPIPTSLVLCEQVEKTAAAIALRTIHSEHQKLVDRGIERVVRHRKVTLERGLTAQDHFYREISKVHEIFDGLQALQGETVLAESPKTIVQTIISINQVFQRVLRDALVVREKKSQEFTPPQSLIDQMEYLPWSSAPGPKGLRTSLIGQVKTSMEKGLMLAENKQVRLEIVNQVVDLIDMVLDGYQSQMQKTRASRKAVVLKQYEKDRNDLISTLVTKGYLDEATSLAEKYLEFVALIRICEMTKSRARLEEYMEKFAQYNFSSFLFDWMVREGKHGKLLSQTSTSRHGELSKFLKGHSNISWLHDIHTNDFGRSMSTLKGLGSQEKDLLGRKKTILSLAKLSALAAEESDDTILSAVQEVEDQLTVIAAQEQLPKCVLEAFNFNLSTMHVLSVREIIELYIGNENIQGDHIDFKKALDMLDFVNVTDDEELKSLRLHIWAKAVLKDSWLDFDVNNPLEAVKETIFFRLVEFCYIQGIEDLGTILPTSQDILDSEELASISGNVNFQFLLRTGYEHIERIVRDEAQQMDL
eukprot:maker-scaffold711_size108467-snap-gene-0.25 protein:Tk04237 transcript:maker-scaffold711_size108467-snap-gene-0.25-mRNA-1 annotation:"hypothetical protein LOTGIDRAFT_233315"